MMNNKTSFRYPAAFAPAEDGGFIVTFRDVPEAITNGDDFEESVQMAQEALALALSLYADNAEPWPSSTQAAKDEVMIELSALDSAKLLLARAMTDQRISKIELASRLSVDEKAARRILQLGHNTKLATLDAAFHAIGRKLVLDVKAA